MSFLVPRAAAGITAATAATAIALLLLPSGCRPKESVRAEIFAPKMDGDRIEFPSDSPQLKDFQVARATEVAAPSLLLTGRLVWNEDATCRIVPPVAGRIDTLVGVGSRVHRGGALAVLTSPDFGQAQAESARAAADLSAAERAANRTKMLFDRGAVPRKDLDASETERSRARVEAGRARARLERWGGDSSASPDQVYRVRSPLDGVVVERNANPGGESRPDAALPLFVVTDPTRLWVLIDVTERDLSAVALGDRIAVRCNAYPDWIFPGSIDWIGQSLDPATRTVRVRGRVEDSSGHLKAEMYVTVEDSGARPRASVLVPTTAVLTDGDQAFCFVQEASNRFRRVAIRVGPERGGHVPVLSGLPPGAVVVTAGSILLASFFSPGTGA